MTMRVAVLLIVSIGGGFGIGHLPPQYQFRAVLAGICLLVLLMSAGCAALEPANVRLGTEHLSSIEQHFGHDPTNIGINLATLSASWKPTSRIYIEVQDGVRISGDYFTGKGGSEVFEARAGVELWQKEGAR
jgi:hypothetical protein